MPLHQLAGSRLIAALGLPLVALGATSCSPVPPSAEREAQAETKDFTEEDRRIASALSVGSTALLDNDASPLQRALDCNAALDFLVARLDNSGILNPEQRGAVDRIQNYYQNEITRLESELDPESVDGAETAGNPQAEEMNNAKKAQLGMACLRQGAEAVS